MSNSEHLALLKTKEMLEAKVVSLQEDIAATQKYRDVLAQMSSGKVSHGLSLAFMSILENIHDPVLFLDPDLQIVWANTRFHTLFREKTEDEVIGKYCYELEGRDSPCESCPSLYAQKHNKIGYLENFNVHMLHSECKVWAIPIRNGSLKGTIEVFCTPDSGE